MDELLDPDLVDTSIQIYRPIDGGADVFREFTATIEYSDDDGPTEIGVVRGWIGWGISDEDIHDAADAISADAEVLGAAAAEIMEAHVDRFLDDALLIDRMSLAAEFRGRRLSGAIVRNLLDLLRMSAEDTVVVLQPEPQAAEGGPIADRLARAKALERLKAAYLDSGFEPWNDSAVWWLPLP